MKSFNQLRAFVLFKDSFSQGRLGKQLEPVLEDPTGFRMLFEQLSLPKVIKAVQKASEGEDEEEEKLESLNFGDEFEEDQFDQLLN